MSTPDQPGQWPFEAHHAGFKPGEVIIISAARETGKSWFMKELQEKLARQHEAHRQAIDQAMRKERIAIIDDMFMHADHEAVPECLPEQPQHKPTDTSLRARQETSRQRKAQIRIPNLLRNMVESL